MRAGIRAVRGIRSWLLLAGMLVLLPAVADATTYTFTTGSATVSATYDPPGPLPIQTIGAGSIPLSGTLVEFDTFPTPSVVTFDFDAAGPNVVPLSGLLTGTSITLSNVQLAPGIGYTNFSVTGGPSVYNYTVGPVAVSGNAGFSGVINTPSAPFSFVNPALSGQVQLGTGTITLTGITLGVINVPAAGSFPGGPVTIKADIVFTGVPEPGTVFLLGGGLAMIAAAGRRVRRD